MKWLRAYLSIPFIVLAVFIAIFKRNRLWLEERLSRKLAARWTKGIAVATVLAWLLIWLFNR